MSDLIKTMTILNDVESYKNDLNCISNYEEELFDLNYCSLIKKNADVIIPKYLVLHLQDNGKLYLVNEIKEEIMLSSLICKLDNIHVYNISLKLLFELSSPKILNNKLYILLPPYLFDKSIFNIKNNRTISLQLLCRGELLNILTCCSIILYKETFLKKNVTDFLIDKPYTNNKHIIQQTQTLFIRPTMRKDFFANDLNLKGLMKGIFIQGNIYELIELKIFIDYQVYLHYDIHSIHGYCKRISSNLIFLPIMNNCDYTTNNNTDFINVFNLNNIDSVTITLRFRTPQEYIFLHVLMKNEIIELQNNYRLSIYRNLEQLSISNAS